MLKRDMKAKENDVKHIKKVKSASEKADSSKPATRSQGPQNPPSCVPTGTDRW